MEAKVGVTPTAVTPLRTVAPNPAPQGIARMDPPNSPINSQLPSSEIAAQQQVSIGTAGTALQLLEVTARRRSAQLDA